MSQSFNVRAYDRFRLEPMYTCVTVQRVRDMRMEQIAGHAYDVSEVGVRVELDARLEADERVGIALRLPGASEDIVVSGRVIWTHEDVDDPAASRTALQFIRFGSPDDRSRLLRYLGTSGLRRSA